MRFTNHTFWRYWLVHSHQAEFYYFDRLILDVKCLFLFSCMFQCFRPPGYGSGLYQYHHAWGGSWSPNGCFQNSCILHISAEVIFIARMC